MTREGVPDRHHCGDTHFWTGRFCLIGTKSPVRFWFDLCFRPLDLGSADWRPIENPNGKTWKTTKRETGLNTDNIYWYLLEDGVMDTDLLPEYRVTNLRTIQECPRGSQCVQLLDRFSYAHVVCIEEDKSEDTSELTTVNWMPSKTAVGYVEVADQYLFGKYKIPNSANPNSQTGRSRHGGRSRAAEGAHMLVEMEVKHDVAAGLFSAVFESEVGTDLELDGLFEIFHNDASEPLCSVLAHQAASCRAVKTADFRKGDALRARFDLELSEASDVVSSGRSFGSIFYSIVDGGS